MIQQNTFPKSEHLCGECIVAELFSKGDAFVVYPFRAVFRLVECTSGGQVKLLVSVPKKRFKRAVKRNRIKRLMREAYRLNKHDLLNELPSNIEMHLAFQYVADVEIDLETLELKLKQVFLRLLEKLNASKSVNLV